MQEQTHGVPCARRCFCSCPSLADAPTLLRLLSCLATAEMLLANAPCPHGALASPHTLHACAAAISSPPVCPMLHSQCLQQSWLLTALASCVVLVRRGPDILLRLEQIYVGNLVQGLVTEDALRQLFNSTMKAAFPEQQIPGMDPVVTVSMHSEGRYAFVELRTPDMASAALQLSGQVQLLGQSISVGRPSGYVDPSAAQMAAAQAATALSSFEVRALQGCSGKAARASACQ